MPKQEATMSRMLSFLLALSILSLTLTPFVSWAAQNVMKHDCRQERPKGSYYCERGPLAGKRFASQKAMVAALTHSSKTQVNRNDGKASAGSPSNVKASVR
jgi:hypothetical protein